MSLPEQARHCNLPAKKERAFSSLRCSLLGDLNFLVNNATICSSGLSVKVLNITKRTVIVSVAFSKKNVLRVCCRHQSLMQLKKYPRSLAFLVKSSEDYMRVLRLKPYSQNVLTLLSLYVDVSHIQDEIKRSSWNFKIKSPLSRKPLLTAFSSSKHQERKMKWEVLNIFPQDFMKVLTKSSKRSTTEHSNAWAVQWRK